MGTKETWRKKAYLKEQGPECDFGKFYHHGYETVNDTILCVSNFLQIILKREDLLARSLTCGPK